MGNLPLHQFLANPENVKFLGYNSSNLYQRYSVAVNVSPSELQRRLALKHPHILQPVSVYQNILEYEVPPTSLASLIANRIPDNYFTESEILSLLRGIASALSFLQENGIAHGDINPETIFWDPKDSCYKIIDNDLVQGSNSGLQAFRTKKRAAYLSPQFIQIARNEYVEKFPPNKFKADIFSLGLSILEMATFMSVSSCYDLSTLTANFPLAEKFFLIFKQNYEIEFAHYLKIMINSEEVVRPSGWEMLRIMLNLGDGKLPIKINDGISPLSWCYLRQQFKKGRIHNASFSFQENPLAHFNNTPQNNHFERPMNNYVSPPRNPGNHRPDMRFNSRHGSSQRKNFPNTQYAFTAEIQQDYTMDAFGNPVSDGFYSARDIGKGERKGIREIKDFFNASNMRKSTMELESKIDTLLQESNKLINKVLSSNSKEEDKENSQKPKEINKKK